MTSVEVRVNQLENALRTYVESKSGFGDFTKQKRLLVDTFKQFDRDRSGYLDEEEFEAALIQKVNVVGCKETIAELFDRYDEDVSGQISYSEFVVGLFGDNRISEQKETDFIDIGAGRQKSNSLSEVVGTVKEKILSRAGRNAGIRSFHRILRSMDLDGSNTLGPFEVLQGMETFNLKLTKKQLSAVMEYFDRDKSGKISIEEFLRGLRGRMSRSRKKLVRLAWQQLVSALQLDGECDTVTVEDLGKYYDVTKNPRVISGEISETEALQVFMSSWDRDGDFRVTWLEFLDYYRDLSAGIENDEYFELMIRNAWHLSGGDGWAANTSNRRVLITLKNGQQRVVEIKNDFTLPRSPTTLQIMEKLSSDPEMILLIDEVVDVSMTD